jgi:protein phosphatase 2C family protein 2/3
MAGLKDQSGEGPLSAEPEMQHAVLTEEDEFLVIGCDGLWDVFTSQNAVDFARKELQLHNDPERCSRELVAEALRRYSCDNLTVLTVCFKMEPPPQRVCASRPRRFSATGISNLQGFLNDCPPVEGLCNL